MGRCQTPLRTPPIETIALGGAVSITRVLVMPVSPGGFLAARQELWARGCGQGRGGSR